MSNFKVPEDTSHQEISAKNVVPYNCTKDKVQKSKETNASEKQQRYNHWLQKARKNEDAKKANSRCKCSSVKNRESMCGGVRNNANMCPHVGPAKETTEKTKCCDSSTEQLRDENRMLRSTLMSVKNEQTGMGKALDNLQGQISSLVTYCKCLKSHNISLEKALGSRQAETTQGEYLQESKDKVDKSPRERSQSKSGTEESIDEGYADGSLVVCPGTTLPTPPLLDPVLLATISDLLSESQDFLKPIEDGLDELKQKLNDFQQDAFTQLDQLSLAADYRSDRIDLFSEKNYNSI